MDDHVRVPPDRRGEVRVHGCGQTVVMPLVLRDLARAEVLRRHHTPSRQDAQELVEVRVFRTHR